MKRKRLLAFASLPMLALLLAGCGQQTPRTGKPGGLYGILYNILGAPMQHLMEWMASHMGHSYGLAIVVLVIVVRLILLPVMFSQMKGSTEMQERMSKIQPALKELQQRQKNATPQEQAQISQQMMSLYRDNHINMFGGVGCLPLLIQLPIFSALYMAIQYFPEMAHSTFLGIPLGKPSWLLAILSFVVYLIQAGLAMIGVPKAQQKQMGATMLMSPVMTFIIAISSSAGLGLYFFIGGLFAILQTLMVNAYRPRIRKRIEQEMKDHPIKVPEMPKAATANAGGQSAKTADAISQLRAGGHSGQANAKALADATTSERRNRQRNAGKQQHRHSQRQQNKPAPKPKPSQATKPSPKAEHQKNRQRNAGKQRHHHSNN